MTPFLGGVGLLQDISAAGYKNALHGQIFLCSLAPNIIFALQRQKLFMIFSASTFFALQCHRHQVATFSISSWRFLQLLILVSCQVIHFLKMAFKRFIIITYCQWLKIMDDLKLNLKFWSIMEIYDSSFLPYLNFNHQFSCHNLKFW